MKDFLEVIYGKWDSFTDNEKEIIANTFFIKSNMTIKDGDIVVVNIPIDKDTGYCLIEYDILEMYHKNIKNAFKDHQVIMSPLDISIISNENIDVDRR